MISWGDHHITLGMRTSWDWPEARSGPNPKPNRKGSRQNQAKSYLALTCPNGFQAYNPIQSWIGSKPEMVPEICPIKGLKALIFLSPLAKISWHRLTILVASPLQLPEEQVLGCGWLDAGAIAKKAWDANPRTGPRGRRCYSHPW